MRRALFFPFTNTPAGRLAAQRGCDQSEVNAPSSRAHSLRDPKGPQKPTTLILAQYPACSADIRFNRQHCHARRRCADEIAFVASIVANIIVVMVLVSIALPIVAAAVAATVITVATAVIVDVDFKANAVPTLPPGPSSLSARLQVNKAVQQTLNPKAV